MQYVQQHADDRRQHAESSSSPLKTYTVATEAHQSFLASIREANPSYSGHRSSEDETFSPKLWNELVKVVERCQGLNKIFT